MTISIFRSKGRYLWELGTGGGVEGEGGFKKIGQRGGRALLGEERGVGGRGEFDLEKHIRFAF